MRLWAVAAVAPIGLLLFLLVALGAQQEQAFGTPGMMCAPAGAVSSGSVAGFSGESLTIATEIVAVGKRRELPAHGWQIAVQAGMAESGLRNLPYGDRDSLGVFQMRPSQGWGAPSQLLEVEYQVRTFYDALIKVPGWQRMRPGDAAQAVERSAFPDRYHEFEAAALAVIGAVEGIDCPRLDTAAVVRSAASQIGVPYAWGGGSTAGPSRGLQGSGDGDTVGFDCSSLMLYAYHQGTDGELTLPRTSRDQYQATRTRQVAPNQLAPGDLLFYGPSPAGIHHVAMYIGGGQMIEAPQSGQHVQVAAVRLDADFFRATRVLV